MLEEQEECIFEVEVELLKSVVHMAVVAEEFVDNQASSSVALAS
jgi:hypothetical protein